MDENTHGFPEEKDGQYVIPPTPGDVRLDGPLDTDPFSEKEEEVKEEETEEDKKEEEEFKEAAKEQAVTLLERIGLVADAKRTKFLLRSTPKKHIYTRPARGGGEWKYIRGEYVKQALNAIFAFQWDFEIVPVTEGQLFYMTGRQVIVMGKLTIRDSNGVARIIKMGIGKKDVAYLKGKDGKPSAFTLDVGNDIKAAETDALKRCATGVGIGLDLYSDEQETEIKGYSDEQ